MLKSSLASFYVVPALSPRSIPVVAGVEIDGRNIDLLPVDSPSLSLMAVGIGDTAGSTGVVLARGSEARLPLVGKGILPGVYYMVGNDTGGLSVRQPFAAEFTQTTDGTPAVRLQVSVSPMARLGPLNIIVLNVAGELAAFAGGVSIAE